jgi:cytochrome c-type biogenesis protein CcmH/NrfG
MKDSYEKEISDEAKPSLGESQDTAGCARRLLARHQTTAYHSSMTPRFPAGICLLSFIISSLLVEIGSPVRQQAWADSSSQEGPTEADLEEELRKSRERLRLSSEFAGTDAGTHIRLAEALHHRGDLTGATEEYQAAIKLNPELTEPYRGLGVVSIDRHDWIGAVDALTIATRRQPNDAEAFYWLGRALMARGAWEGASEALTTALRLKPDDAEAYGDLGLVRMAQGNPEAAVEALRQAITLKPDNADVHGLLETVLMHQHDPEHVAHAARQMLDTMFARE